MQLGVADQRRSLGRCEQAGEKAGLPACKLQAGLASASDLCSVVGLQGLHGGVLERRLLVGQQHQVGLGVARLRAGKG